MSDALRVLDRAGAERMCSIIRKAGCRVVFTNGCFDLLHPGHILVLSRAAVLGDFLFVGLNSDSSVKRLKGDMRPRMPLEARAAVLSSLRFVDFVVPFSEDTPLELIRALRPHILVKGGDYRAEDVVGAGLVEKVVIVPTLAGHSTTALISE
jgi:D-beta-D-heptose 7-phosphate kinase/D-beta-D-heptose 1-phosphate adenosyltransferase